MKEIKICNFTELENKKPLGRQVNGLDLVIIRYGKNVSVLYGRCLHRGALLADGYIEGNNLICSVLGWDYRLDTGISEYNNEEALHKFHSVIRDEIVYIDEDEINQYLSDHPQPFKRDEYLGQFADTNPEDTEPYNAYIHELARNGLKNRGAHGSVAAMGVDRNTLPKWEDI